MNQVFLSHSIEYTKKLEDIIKNKHLDFAAIIIRMILNIDIN